MSMTLLPVDHDAQSRPAVTEMPSEPVRVDWPRLIRAEYRESPGLHLTAQQARRLWNLDPQTCDALLANLVNTRFLRRTETGAYARAD
jgi:hypothetical protein